jgi:hypothetical protein
VSFAGSSDEYRRVEGEMTAAGRVRPRARRLAVAVAILALALGLTHPAPIAALDASIDTRHGDSHVKNSAVYGTGSKEPGKSVLDVSSADVLREQGRLRSDVGFSEQRAALMLLLLLRSTHRDGP